MCAWCLTGLHKLLHAAEASKCAWCLTGLLVRVSSCVPGALPGCIPDTDRASRPLVNFVIYSPFARARRPRCRPPHVSSPAVLSVHSGGLKLKGSSLRKQHRITWHTPSFVQWRKREISMCDMSFSCCRRVRCMMHRTRVDYRPFSACPEIQARPNLDLTQMMVVLDCWFFFAFRLLFSFRLSISFRGSLPSACSIHGRENLARDAIHPSVGLGGPWDAVP